MVPCAASWRSRWMGGLSPVLDIDRTLPVSPWEQNVSWTLGFAASTPLPSCPGLRAVGVCIHKHT